MREFMMTQLHSSHFLSARSHLPYLSSHNSATCSPVLWVFSVHNRCRSRVKDGFCNRCNNRVSAFWHSGIFIQSLTLCAGMREASSNPCWFCFLYLIAPRSDAENVCVPRRGAHHPGVSRDFLCGTAAADEVRRAVSSFSSPVYAYDPGKESQGLYMIISEKGAKALLDKFTDDACSPTQLADAKKPVECVPIVSSLLIKYVRNECNECTIAHAGDRNSYDENFCTCQM